MKISKTKQNKIMIQSIPFLKAEETNAEAGLDVPASQRNTETCFQHGSQGG